MRRLYGIVTVPKIIKRLSAINKQNTVSFCKKILSLFSTGVEFRAYVIIMEFILLPINPNPKKTLLKILVFFFLTILVS